MSIRQRKVGKNASDAQTAALAALKKAMHIAAAASTVHRIYALDRGFSLGKAAILFQSGAGVILYK